MHTWGHATGLLAQVASASTCVPSSKILHQSALPLQPRRVHVPHQLHRTLPIAPAQQRLSTTANSMAFEDLKSRLGAGQQHVLQDWENLTQPEQQQLARDIQEFDFEFVSRVFSASISAAEQTGATATVTPCTEVLRLTDGSEADRSTWRAHGLDLIAQGKVAVLLLAGGQGTRLGSAAPKGCYDIGLPSHKSLFQLQAERLLRLQQLAAQHASDQGAPAPLRPLRWVVMTSPFTHEETVGHFKEHAFFGLEESQVTFFQQGSLPCMTGTGQVIMSSASSIAKAPDGNGGVYMSLQGAGVLDLLEKEGVEALDCYCVDNALARLGDPLFVGYCDTQGAQVGARVVAKAYPEEKVGVFAKRDGVTCVVEYSEMEPGQASAVDPDSGALLYNWSNICMHYFSVAWLRQVCAHLGRGAAYHVARKNIPSKDGPVQGIKLELFIFDTFPIASGVTLMEVNREAEFAPVKNAPGSATDSPDTARAAVLALGAAWVVAAGGQLEAPPTAAATTSPAAAGGAPSAAVGVEVSPLVSYAGEGLGLLVEGRVVAQGLDPRLQGRVP